MATDILIVDDERDIRSLISMTLEDEGYATKQAAGAAEARNLLLSEPPKLAIEVICLGSYMLGPAPDSDNNILRKSRNIRYAFQTKTRKSQEDMNKVSANR